MSTQLLHIPQAKTALPCPELVDIVDKISVDNLSPARSAPDAGSTPNNSSRAQALLRLGVQSSVSSEVPWQKSEKSSSFFSALHAFGMGCMVLLYRHCLGMFLGVSKTQLVIRSLLCASVALVASVALTQYLQQTWMFLTLSSVLFFLSIGVVLSLCGFIGKGIILGAKIVTKVGQENL